MLSISDYYGRLDNDTVVTDDSLIRQIFPVRRQFSNKGDYGRLLIIAGSAKMTGAAVLSARAALRGGTGLVEIAADREIIPILQCALYEPVFFPFSVSSGALSSSASLNSIADEIKKCTACLLGPGLGCEAGSAEIVKAVIECPGIPKLLDADALNAVALHNIDIQKNEDIIITPHPGEFSRLTGYDIQYIQSHRIETAREFSVRRRVITVLKGAYTIIATPSGRCYINPTGNSALSKGGSGDVLSGLMASLLACGIKPEHCAVLACYLHGLAADTLRLGNAAMGMLPSDIIDILPSVEKQFEGPDV